MNKKSFNIELYLGIIATFIALLSVAIAVWEGVETRTHNRLSVKPILVFSKTYNVLKTADGKTDRTTMTLDLINRGLGPAIIRRFDILSADGKRRFASWKLAMDTMNYADQLTSSADMDGNSVLEAGDVHTLLVLELPLSAVSEAVEYSQLSDIQLQIQYESIYEEEFEVEITDLLSQQL